ncbi:MAG: permease prefix domain 1-containing protein [Gemmataceae bacterium]|nr:permease prefix domain 1-containing protein [Gemmataceae bacterium]MCI0742422.1 permease prefix domain 1-containing protein [Gemmataceae bacterium]
MDKLEQYLDQVCRGLAGSRSMRQHIRQELREHLRDAMAGHKAAGMSEEEALGRALADFGGPAEVRSELEATHGQRFFAVVIDKAIEWKERTMRAKWLWLSWAHLAFACVIVVEILLLTYTKIFLVPKLHKLIQDGWLPGATTDPELSWLLGLLAPLDWMARYATWIVLAAAALWALFEWRVRSENKSFMRLSALGTTAFALLVSVVLTTMAMLLLFFLGLPGGVILGPRVVNDLTANIDASVGALEQGIAQKDWEAIQHNAKRAAHSLETLAWLENQQNKSVFRPKWDKLWSNVQWAKQNMDEAQQAIAAKDANRLGAALDQFRQAYAPVRRWATRVQEGEPE